MIGVSWWDHRTNEWVRSKTKVHDIVHVIEARKWSWAGHITRLQDNRWTSQKTDRRLPWMVVDQEVDTRRDGGMKSMTSRDLLHESRMSKTDCNGITMLRPSSNNIQYWLNMTMMMMNSCLSASWSFVLQIHQFCILFNIFFLDWLKSQSEHFRKFSIPEGVPFSKAFHLKAKKIHESMMCIRCYYYRSPTSSGTRRSLRKITA